MKLEFSRQIKKNSKLMKISPEGDELFHAGGRADGRTGRHDATNSRFSQSFERA